MSVTKPEESAAKKPRKKVKSKEEIMLSFLKGKYNGPEE
jgi:hypothetical protein